MPDGFLPVVSCQWLRCHLSSNVLRTDSKGWGVSKFRKCRARCGESRANVDKCSELALIVEEVLLQRGNIEDRMREGRERKVRSSSFFYQNTASRARKKMDRSPCSSRSCLAAMQRGHRHRSIAYIEGIVVYSSAARIISLGCGPRGTLPSRHAWRYSRCHCLNRNYHDDM